jgi:hypothetical protein
VHFTFTFYYYYYCYYYIITTTIEHKLYRRANFMILGLL